ncbi:MAG: large conductance mechanosensitive channel protein MscL [Chloroflexi bacterium]|nr:large conductance mechanosensitive channel protein MscL [Chloroflexota bacterium]
MKLFREFKEFVVKGNALELAVGVIIGGAFGAVVNSLVKDILMPPIGLLLGKVDFTNLYIPLNAAARALPAGTTLTEAQDSGAIVLAYGSFLTTVISFVIIAFCIFLVIKALNQARRSADIKAGKNPDAPTNKACPFCKSDIPIAATRCPHCTSQLEG